MSPFLGLSSVSLICVSPFSSMSVLCPKLTGIDMGVGGMWERKMWEGQGGLETSQGT